MESERKLISDATNEFELRQFVDHNSFCTFITCHDDGLFVSHINLINVGDTYFGHLSAANPQAKMLKDNSAVVALFKDKQSSDPNGKVVHLHGNISLINDEHELSGMLDKLISKYESGRSMPWSAKWNEPQFKAQMKGIVGFHVTLTKIEEAIAPGKNHSKKNVAAPIDAECMRTFKVTPIYTPPCFVEKRLDILHQLIKNNSSCTAIIHNKNGFIHVYHTDLTISSSEGDKLVLAGQLVLANTRQSVKTGDVLDALLIFNGSHTYISPTWYKAPHSVPTWNYVTAHAQGAFTVMSKKIEGDDLILNVRFDVSHIEGKYKLNQNRTIEDKCSVVSALSESSCPADYEVSELMKTFSLTR